jgi:hypothetical protein
MLTFVFDASGDDNTQFLTMAGFASSANDWDDFSLAWKNRLERDGIEYFRTVDFNACRGPFKHWHDREDRETLQRQLSSDLMEIIKTHVYRKVSCTIINKEFQEMDEEFREQFSLCAYSLAGRTCEKYARKWILEDWRRSPDMPIALIFEAGDKGYGKLQEKLVRDMGHLPPNFRLKKDTLRDDGMVERGFIPLQAADWLAWEINRAARDLYEGKASTEHDLRWPMQQFLRWPFGFMGTYTPQNLKEMESGFVLQETIDEWATAAGLAKKRGTP